MPRTTPTLPLALALAFVLAVPPTAPASDLEPGSPVTAARAADTLEVIRVVDAIDAAVDAKDWVATESLFAEELRVDFTALMGGEPSTMPASALVGAWSANLTAEKTSFHLRGNHRVTFEGEDRATVHSHGYAWNRLERGAAAENGGDPLWEVWGSYVHGLRRTEEGWRVDAMTFVILAERGNPFVRNTPGQ
ncbi:MAG: nuclear transport factor 2 family protein [Pseudomonadota bacterium]